MKKYTKYRCQKVKYGILIRKIQKEFRELMVKGAMDWNKSMNPDEFPIEKLLKNQSKDYRGKDLIEWNITVRNSPHLINNLLIS